MNINYWRLGQLFFRKYPTFLSYEGNTSSFLYYSKNKEKKEDGGNTDAPKTDGSDGEKSDGSDGKDGKEGKNNNGPNNGLVIALSIVIPLIVIAIIIVAIYFYRKRNKKVDELLSDKVETEGEKKFAILNNS